MQDFFRSNSLLVAWLVFLQMTTTQVNAFNFFLSIIFLYFFLENKPKFTENLQKTVVDKTRYLLKDATTLAIVVSLFFFFSPPTIALQLLKLPF